MKLDPKKLIEEAREKADIKAHTIDIFFRKDGVDHRREGDWIRILVPALADLAERALAVFAQINEFAPGIVEQAEEAVERRAALKALSDGEDSQ